ncbi:MAG: UDP-N-acetylmuramoyl-tripeptide--D-alanyl-D-alanine ligase [Kiritimatiellales bacterium]
MYRSDEIAAWLSRDWKNADASFPILGICHDTRTLKPGEIYIAIKGAVHDGHDFVEKAVEAGAAGLIVEREFPMFGNLPQMVVPDAMKALHDLAVGARKEWGGTVIGITGSVGKTTVKEMIASVLVQKGAVSKTKGNWNNDIGLPLSMLAADRTSDFFVFELGMSRPGEIAALASLLRPDWAVITDIGKAHIEFFQSLEKIAEEKASLLSFADSALLDETSEWFNLFKRFCKERVVTFGDEAFEFTVPQPGDHMIRNARRAAALGRELGLTPQQIQNGLNSFSSGSMRWERSEENGVVFINDAYNANPLSMRAALSAFAAMPCSGRRFAVLGAMRELGASSDVEHRELGAFVDTLGLAGIITIGDEGAKITCRGILGATKDEAVFILRGRLRAGDAVLFKASRGERLETVLNDLKATL